MQLELGLLVPSTGARTDVLVRAPAGTTLAELAPRLLARVLPAGAIAQLSTGAGPVSPRTRLGAPPLLHGTLLTVEADPRTRVELHVLEGPGGGHVHRLPLGEVVVGRDADVRLDDPELSRRHCRLRLTPEGVTVVDLGSTNGTTVDGAAVGAEPVSLPPGAVLRLGRTSVALLPAPPPAAGPASGRRAFHRPPRLRTPQPAVRVVLPTPPAEPDRHPLPLVAIVAPLLLGLGMWRLTGSTTFLLFTLLSPLLIVGNVVTERRTGTRRRRRDLSRWRAQREEAEAALAAAVHEDERLRRAAQPEPAQVLLTALTAGQRLWERRAEDDDLLDLRVGVADQPARVDAEGDVAAGAATARSVPLVVPLREVGVLGVVGSGGRALATWLVAQAAVAHSPRDLQVVVAAQSASAAGWEWARWLPHARPDAGQDCRALLGLGARQAAARVRELLALVELRRGQPDLPHRAVLLVLDGVRAMPSLPGLARVLSEGPAVGVHAVCVEAAADLLPEQCRATAVVESGAVDLALAGRGPLPRGMADTVTPVWAERLARALAPLEDAGQPGEAGGLPSSLRWSDLVELPLDGSAGDGVRIAQRWSASGRSTVALLGRSADGSFAVDLSRDGPHALVAGTTGSGKSELLQTLIASLALANRPDELTFVLVDYKGGAAFGPCAGLPHTVGLVTDLDGALVERALASLTAELARREQVLAAVGAKDVEEHQRWADARGQRPLPRLVLVVDEFASLAEELPDFVGGLVGIAMRGRSLGVHLVLATQRPEGVVSADIRANTNLRLCLAVARDSESRDVVDSPLAARIPRGRPGRGYARTGHTELTAFQTARVGGRRAAPAATTPEPTVELLPGCEVGDPLPRPPHEQEDAGQPSDLALLVAGCAAAAAQLGLGEQPSPWLPPLPEQVLLGDLPHAPDPWADRPARVPPLAYALLDEPGAQAQRALTLDLDRAGHLLVVGAARTGRTTVLRTLAGAVARSTCSDDVHLYALDLGGGGLSPLRDLPHTGAVVGPDEPERVERLLGWLAAEVSRRQALLGDAGCADLVEQRAGAAPADRLPHLVLLVDRWEAFVSTWGELDGGRLVDLVHRLLREGSSVGLHLVLTCDRSGLVGRLSSLVDDRVLLRLADPVDYGAAGLPPRAVPRTLPPGRGWSLRAPALAAQVALLHDDSSGAAQAAALEQLAALAPRPQRHRPHRIEPLPARVRLRALPPSRPGEVAVLLGVGGDELTPVELDLAEVHPGLLVGGPPGSGRSTALVSLGSQLRRNGLPVVAVAPRPSPLRDLPGLAGCVTDSSGAYDLERLLATPAVLLVDDAELLVDNPLAPALEQAVRSARDAGSVVVAAGTTDALLLGYRGFVVDLRRSRTGLLLSPQAAADGDLLGVRLSRATGGPVRPGRALLVRRGEAEPLQLAEATRADWSE